VELRPGYKQTEVGVIPEDWDVKPLAAITDKIMVGIASAATYAYRPNGVPLFRNQNIKNGRLDDTDLLFVEPDYELAFRNKRLRAGDLLTMRTGYPGVTAIVPAKYDSSQSFTTLISRPKPHAADSNFLCHYINSDLGQEFFAQSQIGGAQKNVNAGTLREMPVLLPSVPEQRAIATALNDVDALLEVLTRLIAKKRDLKQAAMQQLLTGKTRLSGFHDEWQPKRLGELAEMDSGGTPPASVFAYYDGAIPWASISDMTKSGKVMTGTERSLSQLGFINSAAKMFPVGSVLYALYASLGECSVAGIPLCSSQAILGIRPHASLHNEFLYYYLIYLKPVVKTLGQHGTQANLNKPMVQDFRLELPSVAEQIVIATMLSDMDAELSALEARRDKTRALKQAMMQELLTGRTRLVIPAATESKNAERTNDRRANIHFKRSVLAAEIIDRLHDEPTFGHVKFEKMIFLVEQLCEVDTGSTYHRDAAGPYDNRALRSIDTQLRKQKWFDAQKIADRYRYAPMANRGKHKEYFERYFGGIGTAFDSVIETFRTLTTERCEIVATLFAAWRDLVQQNGPVPDDVIVNEVLNNWHESKKRIPEERWRKALSWMRDHGFVPRKAIGA